jgi:pantetheine-phosphate adenylyltransferase
MDTGCPTTALYPGTFDPLTNGHVGIVRRALTIFDCVILGIAADTGKAPLFNLEERLEMAEEAFEDEDRVEVVAFSGLTVEYARERKVKAIIRGLRAVSDFEMEFQLALINRKLERQIQTVFLMSDFKWLYISSTIVKEVAALGGDVSGLVPEGVRMRLMEKHKEEQAGK